MKCFKCQRYGHIALKCPNQAYYCSTYARRPVPYALATAAGDAVYGAGTSTLSTVTSGAARSGLVNGSPVSDIILDTGCTQTMVHKSLVDARFLLSEHVCIRCAHGDVSSHPTAIVDIDVGGHKCRVKAGVSDTLPNSVLLGRDVPELDKLLSNGNGLRDVLAITRAQSKRAEQEHAIQLVRELVTKSQPVVVREERPEEGQSQPVVVREEQPEEGQSQPVVVREERPEEGQSQPVVVREERPEEGQSQPVVVREERPEEGQWLGDAGGLHADDGAGKEQISPIEPWLTLLDDEVIVPARRESRKSRRARRRDKVAFQEMTTSGQSQSPEDTTAVLRLPKNEFATRQKSDPTLKRCWARVGRSPCPASSTSFYVEDGLLYRNWRRKDDVCAVNEQRQLVLPRSCRTAILQMAHEIPLAGHLGRDKTLNRVLQRFYWPGCFEDVESFCSSCAECQKTVRPTRQRVPLVSIPPVGEPFRRLAMDLVGPLERTLKGNKYILVLVDYATRYPEAIPLKHTDAETIADEIIKVFARVGIPEELLTDQGTNFTSGLMRQVTASLRISRLRTTPYHPQTDGLVERFNGTLKSMLRRFAREAPKSWDDLLPYLLFAYREVPQASTGFSPFELLYGRKVRGPLDVIRESWVGNTETEPTNVLDYVMEMRRKLQAMAEVAQTNLAHAQVKQKEYYDRHAGHRAFEPG